nr:MAG TPA: hypothetical protein [Caudoviricetes sp.]
MSRLFIINYQARHARAFFFALMYLQVNNVQYIISTFLIKRTSK